MIHIYSDTRNLGDNLSCTPILNYYKDSILHMVDDIGCRQIAPIFEGLAEVVFDNDNPRRNIGSHPNKTHERHLLDMYGLNHVSALPVLKLKKEEIEEAREFLSIYNNPIIFKLNPREKKCERSIPENILNLIADNLKNKNTLLNFAINKSGNDILDNLELNGVTTIYNKPIRFQAACYYLIGKYIGPDTGDYRLMLSVGGKCSVLVPPNSFTYSYSAFHLKEERVKYFQFSEYTEAANYLT